MTEQPQPRELRRQVLAGQLSRRDFIVRATALGCSASAISAYLAACGPSPTATPAPAAATTPTARATTAPTAATGASPAATRPAAASPAPGASPGAAGARSGGGLGAATDQTLAKGAGLGPGPSRRGGSGTLKLLWWQGPTILNPHQAQGTKDYDASHVTYEPLASFGPDDKLVPFLAAEIPSVENGGVARDGKSVTWKLKRGVKWSDGQPFTARDVVFTWRYATDQETASVSTAVYQGIDRVEAVDDTTVKITFKDVTPGWYTVFTGPFGMILPEHVFSKGMGSAAKNFEGNLKPVGTGPYKVDDFRPGDLVAYSPNPNWRDDTGPAFDRVELKGGGDAPSAARAVLQTGDYNVAWNLQVEFAVLNQIRQGGKGRLENTPNWGIERILVQFADPNKEVNGQRAEKNTPHPFQADKKVREAYALLCDRKTIADTLYGEIGQPTANILTNPKPYASPNTKWEFNVQKAEQLLAEAGWAKQGQYRQKGGTPLSVLFQTSTNAVRQKHQQLVKAAFEQAGIRMELKAVDAGVYFSSDAGNPDTSSHFYADLEMYTNANDSPDPWNYFSGWITDEIAQQENSWNGANYHRWSNKQYDQLVAQAKTETDEAKRTQMFIRMNDILVDEVVVIPQIDRLGPHAVSNEIKNIQITAWDSLLWNIANWTR